MKYKFAYIFLLAVLVNGCGFKVVNSKVDFRIVNIITSGDKKISYNLKNKLFLNSNDNNEKPVKIILNTNKKNQFMKEI